MKKFIVYSLIFVLAISIAYAENPLYVRFLTKEVDIISPDGTKTRYNDIDEIPEILYSSKIISYGMSILSYHGIDIILKDKQGIFISKDPITKDLIIAKVEDSQYGPIHINFNDTTSAEISPNTKLSLKYDNSSIVSKVLLGNVSMKSNGATFELSVDETFQYILEEGDENAI